MKNILHILLFFVILFPSSMKAQIEKIIVETYYVSDGNDASDSTGGGLETGSKTYRIYIDLTPGSQLKKIYGDANHALKFSATRHFFNNKADGQSFAKDFHKSRYGENTVALDSWLTLGQTTTISSKTYFGVLKTKDRNGSFIGGVNNDGGSASIAVGLLTNGDSAAGIPLTTSDGMDTMFAVPSNWGDYGILDSISGIDSTIFGSSKVDSQFISYNAGLMNSGVAGVIADDNQVLIAQLTTKGEISFELNVEISDTSGHIIKYIANDNFLLSGEVFNRFLKYPRVQTCGCPDPDYLEFLSGRDCDSHDSCKTLVVYGCMDIFACNYNPEANFSIPSLCCYPGHCNDRDISIVCPQLNFEKIKAPSLFNLYPNPGKFEITLQFLNDDYKESKYIIYNLLSKIVMENNFGVVSGSVIQQVNISNLASGVYLFQLFTGEDFKSKIFVKD